jgi:ribosome-binding factor A
LTQRPPPGFQRGCAGGFARNLWGHEPLVAKASSRLGRIGDQIQRDLADLIRAEIKDPRVGMVTLTAVEVTNDHRHAKVFFTALGDHDAVERSRRGLEHASGFLRSQLARGLKLRIVPELHFVHDESVERGVRLSRLIDDAMSSSSDVSDQAKS